MVGEGAPGSVAAEDAHPTERTLRMAGPLHAPIRIPVRGRLRGRKVTLGKRGGGQGPYGAAAALAELAFPSGGDALAKTAWLREYDR